MTMASSTFDIFLYLCLCIAPILFFGWTIFLGMNYKCKRLLQQQRRILTQQATEKQQQLLSKLKHIQKHNLELYRTCQTYQKRVEELSHEISELSQNAQDFFRKKWLRNLPRSFRNETEVEVKFVYPLIRFLGYEDDQIALRYRIKVQVGRQQIQGQADWVIFQKGKPFLVIETKGPNISLAKSEIIEQARSYSFALGTPYYLCTNGQQILLFQRGVTSDRLIIAESAENIEKVWHVLAYHLQKD